MEEVWIGQIVNVSSSGVKKIEYSPNTNLVNILCTYSATQNFFVIYEYDLKKGLDKGMTNDEKKLIKPLQFDTPIMYSYNDGEKVNHFQFIDNINKHDGTRLVTGSEQGMVRIHAFQQPYEQSGNVTFERQFYAEPIKHIKRLDQQTIESLYCYFEYGQSLTNGKPSHKGPSTSNWVQIIYPKAYIVLNVETFEFHAYWMESQKQMNDIAIVPNRSINRQSILHTLLSPSLSETETPINDIHDMMLHRKGQFMVVGSTPALGMYHQKATTTKKRISVRNLAKSFTHSVFSLASTFSSNKYTTNDAEPVSMYLEHAFQDEPREMVQVVVQPSFLYALSSDLLGRILLIDLRTTTIRYIWKGYRLARCIWLSSDHFCIVAPHRRAFEIWKLQTQSKPQRMHAFKLPENDLFYIHHQEEEQQNGIENRKYTCYFGNASGGIYAIHFVN